MDNTVRETGTAPHKAAQDLTTGDFLAAGQLTTGKPTEIMHVQTYPHMRGQETVILHRPIGQTNVLSSTADAEHRFQIATDAEVQAARETTRRYEEIANIHAFADWLKANPSLPISYLRMQVSPGQNVLPHLDVWDSGAEGLAELKRLAEIMGAPLEDGDDRTQAIKTFGPVEYRVIAWHKGPAEPMPAPDSDATGLDYSREADDPTPVSPAWVPAHVGAVTDGGLIDETECYVPNGFQAPEVIAERTAACKARHPSRACHTPKAGA